MNLALKSSRPMLLALLLVALCGCDENYIDTTYGTHDDESINGTDVFADMFTAAGHSVRFVRRRLTERIRQRADCIVWIPDSYHLPATDDRKWLVDDWLLEKGGRTLMYVGRDYDAAPIYWKKMLEGAPQDKAKEFERLLGEATGHATKRRSTMPADWDCDWFRFAPSGAASAPAGRPPAKDANPSDPARLSGEAQWTANIDPGKLEIPLESKLDPVFEADVVLGLDGNVLISRQQMIAHDGGTSQLIVVANGAFLLNMGLVNREHRKLAARLVAEINDPSLAPKSDGTPDAASKKKQVYFLQSDDGGLDLMSEQTPQDLPDSQKWPPERLRTTFLHLAALAIILIVSRWPIFGRPREERTTHEADFGRHVEALGELLARGKDTDDAADRLERYQKMAQGEGAGKTRRT